MNKAPEGTITSLTLPLGKYTLTVEDETFTIRAKGPLDRRYARIVHLVDGGQIPEATPGAS